MAEIRPLGDGEADAYRPYLADVDHPGLADAKRIAAQVLAGAGALPGNIDGPDLQIVQPEELGTLKVTYDEALPGHGLPELELDASATQPVDPGFRLGAEQ